MSETKRIVAWAVCGGLLLAVGCQSTRPTPRPTAGGQAVLAGPPPQLIDSQILRGELGAVLAEVTAANQGPGGQPLPADAMTPDFVPSVAAALSAQCPGLFQVTAQQESAMASGRFNDQLNRDRLDVVVGELAALNVQLPTVGAYLVDQYHKGQLKGPRLELATRLLTCRLDSFKAAAAETTQPAPAR